MSMKMSSYAISSRYLSNAYQQCNNYYKESEYEKNCLETGEMLNLSDFFVSLNYIPQYYKQALLQIVFDAIHLNNTNLFTVTNKHTIFQQNTNKRYEAMTLEVHRKLLSKMAARHAQAIARLQTTGLVGLAVAANPHYTLGTLYGKILRTLQKMPEASVYRRYTEQIVKERAAVLKQTKDAYEIEAAINCGQAEELIIQAENELNLARKMLNWKPWEPLASKPPKGQWDWPPTKA